MMGMGMLMGPPLAGALHDACTSYRPVFIFVSLAFLITAVFLWLSHSLRMHEEDTTGKVF
jgi:cyanate permease